MGCNVAKARHTNEQYQVCILNLEKCQRKMILKPSDTCISKQIYVLLIAPEALYSVAFDLIHT